MTDQTAQYAVTTAQIIGDRDNQEDTLSAHELGANTGEHAGELLLLLADGMGGHAGGEVASKLAVESFAEALRSSLDSANERLAETVAETPKPRGMATTLIGCVINENRMYWISVGDSPLWVFRSGTLHRINADHSMVPVLNELVSEGALDPEEAEPIWNLPLGANYKPLILFGGGHSLLRTRLSHFPVIGKYTGNSFIFNHAAGHICRQDTAN